MASDNEQSERKEQIIAAAMQLFAKFGYRRCTIEDVGAACGLTKTALYHYFATKEDIFAEVVNRECGLLLKTIRDAVATSNSPKVQLKAFFLARFEQIQVLINLHRVSQQNAKEFLTGAEDCRRTFFESEMSLLSSILEAGMKQKVFRKHDPNSVARSMIAAFKGLESHFMLEESKEPFMRALEEAADIFICGLSVPRSQS